MCFSNSEVGTGVLLSVFGAECVFESKMELALLQEDDVAAAKLPNGSKSA